MVNTEYYQEITEYIKANKVKIEGYSYSYKEAPTLALYLSFYLNAKEEKHFFIDTKDTEEDTNLDKIFELIKELAIKKSPDVRVFPNCGCGI